MTRTHGSLFRGSFTALPTPFSGTRIDFASLHHLIQRQIDAGTDGLVLCGSTGESPSLSRDERLSVFEFAVGSAGRRVPIVAGLGAGDTRSVCELAEASARVGASALMVTTPAYSRPSQSGLEAHCAAVAWSSELPILLYNIPSRTGVDLAPETVARIAASHDNVVAIKESSSLERLRDLVQRLDIDVVAGDDGWIADAMELGCAGIVAVVSNLVPGRVSRLVHAFDPDGDPSSAPAEAEAVAALTAVLSIDSNPGPLKAACEMMGLMEGELRLPLVPVCAEHRAKIRAALVNERLIEAD